MMHGSIKILDNVKGFTRTKTIKKPLPFLFNQRGYICKFTVSIKLVIEANHCAEATIRSVWIMFSRTEKSFLFCLKLYSFSQNCAY